MGPLESSSSAALCQVPRSAPSVPETACPSPVCRFFIWPWVKIQIVPLVNIPIPTKIDQNGWCTYPKMVPLVLTHSRLERGPGRVRHQRQCRATSHLVSMKHEPWRPPFGKICAPSDASSKRKALAHTETSRSDPYASKLRPLGCWFHRFAEDLVLPHPITRLVKELNSPTSCGWLSTFAKACR